MKAAQARGFGLMDVKMRFGGLKMGFHDIF